MLVFVVHDSSDAKVAEFDLAPLSEEDVSSLDIAVDDVVCVEVLEGPEDLCDVRHYSRLREALFVADFVEERALISVLEHEVEGVCAAVVAQDADDVGVVQVAQEIDLDQDGLHGVLRYLCHLEEFDCHVALHFLPERFEHLCVRTPANLLFDYLSVSKLIIIIIIINNKRYVNVCLLSKKMLYVSF